MSFPSDILDHKPLIILRADASGKVGFGHFVRTCALARYLAPFAKCLIYSYNDDNSTYFSPWQRQQGDDAQAILFPLPATSLDEANRLFIAKVNELYSTSPFRTERPVIILDNYYFDADYQLQLLPLAKKLICFDDMHLRHFVCHQVVSFIPLRKELFSLEPYTELLAGFEYAPLREPFLAPISNRHTNRTSSNPQQIILAMGGADPLNLTNTLLPQIREIVPEAIINVVAGQTVKLSSETDSMSRVIVHRSISAQEMADLFDTSDLGIFPASTICIEAFARKLPVAIGFFTDNQVDFYHEAINRNLAIPLGDLRNPNLSILTQNQFPRNENFIDFHDARNNFINKILS